MEDNISNIATLIIAICAILLTICQIYATRRHNRLGVRPLLKFGWTTDEKNDGIGLTNVGLGPAIITKFIIIHKQKVITTKELTDYLEKKGYVSGMFVAGFGSTIQPRDMKWVIRSEKNLDSKRKVKEYWDILEGLTFIVEYKCFYRIEQSKIKWKCPNPIKEFVSVKTKKIS